MDPAERLFIHKIHPEWGIGMWVREEMTRRRMRFDDGELRVFKKGFYHLLIPVDVEKVDVAKKVREIGSEHDVAMAEKRQAKLRKNKAPKMTLAQQVRVFKHLYPGGFTDESFIQDHLRPTGKRSRKSHHGVSVERAQLLLSRDVMESKIEEGDWEGIHANACEVMTHTTFVSRSMTVTPIENLEDDARDAFAKGVYELLYGDEEHFSKRFASWLAVLRDECGLQPEWPLATVFPGLVFPKEHAIVKPRIFDMQGRQVSPGRVIVKRPSKQGYKRALRVAVMLQEKLADHDVDMPDLLHARIFIWETLRPRGQQVLSELEGR